VRKYDDVAQRQHRIGTHLTDGREGARLGLGCHDPDSLSCLPLRPCPRLQRRTGVLCGGTIGFHLLAGASFATATGTPPAVPNAHTKRLSNRWQSSEGVSSCRPAVAPGVRRIKPAIVPSCGRRRRRRGADGKRAIKTQSRQRRWRGRRKCKAAVPCLQRLPWKSPPLRRLRGLAVRTWCRAGCSP
jgi:hypothetical protein